MRSQEFITEAFDQPYRLRWEKGDHGDVDAVAKMDDGNYLSIMFNKGFSQDTKEEAWSVEFYRNNSQEVTLEGDAYRVFATVLTAIQTFVKKYKPNKIFFAASKEGDPSTYYEPGEPQPNPESRAKLYDRMVQRYARAWGFRAFRADTGNKVMYELSRIKPVAEGSLNEGSAHPVIVVDVQPEYSGMNDGDESSVFPQIINFVNKQTGPVLMFVNAEDQGLSGDTIPDIKQYWDDTICPEEERYTHDEETDEYIENTNCPRINWQRFAIADKGYGYFRSWMDHGIEPATIIATIRELYQQKKNDSRELQFPASNQRTPQQSLIMGAMQEMEDDPISVNWTSVAQLKRFNGAYIVGGARDQCLREVELLMNAFNIRYKRIDSLVYEGQQGMAEGSWANNNVMGHIAKNLTGQGSPIAKIRHKRDTEREKLGSISYGYRQDPNLKTTHKQVPFSEDGVKEAISNPEVKSWIEKVYDLYPQTFQNNHVMPLGGSGDDQQFAMFELVPSFSKQGAVEVKWFQAYPLRQGVGSRAMQELQRLAQEDGIALTLFPWDKGQVSQSKLMKFYKGAGFRPTVNGSKSLAWSPENMAEGLNENAVMAKIEQSGQIIRILKKAHTVPFSDEKNWLLVDVDPAKGNKGLGLKWIPANTRFEWVRPYRDTVDENFADGKKPGRKGLAKRSGVDCKQPVAKLRSIAANSSGERQRMAHWCANMKSGKKK